LHPCSVKNDFEKVLADMERLLDTNKYIAIGETGLDLYWDKTTLNIQRESLKYHILWAKKYHLPIVLHCRESFEPTIELIEQTQDGTLTGVFHCFGGSKAEAERILNVGFYVGIGGVATYKKCDVSTVLSQIDPQKILLETDCPYLAPVPHRGQRNEPAFISHVAQQVADSIGISYEETVRLTHRNALALFTQLPSNPQSN
jgi:TatD DNase family protein